MLGRMLFHLYIRPFLLILAAPLTLYCLGSEIPEAFSATRYLAPLGQTIASAAPWISISFLLFGLLWGINSTIRYWRWSQGGEECCYLCGGLVDKKNGRYGLYYKCLACGKTRSAY